MTRLIERFFYNLTDLENIKTKIVLDDIETRYRTAYYYYLYRNIGIIVLFLLAIFSYFLGFETKTFFYGAIFSLFVHLIYSIGVFYLVIPKLKEQYYDVNFFKKFFIIDVIYMYLGPTLMMFFDKGTESPIFYIYFLVIIGVKVITYSNYLIQYLLFYPFYILIIVYSYYKGYRVDLSDEILKFTSYNVFFLLYYLHSNFYEIISERLKYSIERIKSLITINKIYRELIDSKIIEESINVKEIKKKKSIVVMGCFKEFSEFYYKTKDEDWLKFLGLYYNIIEESVYYNGAVLDKFVADNFIVRFELDSKTPKEVYKNLENFIHYILNQFQTLIVKEFSSLIVKDNVHFIFSITYGEVGVGVFGEGMRKTYTAIGVAVNKAERILSIFKNELSDYIKDDIVVAFSDDLKEFLDNNNINVVYSKIGEFNLKGINEDISNIYKLEKI